MTQGAEPAAPAPGARWREWLSGWLDRLIPESQPAVAPPFGPATFGLLLGLLAVWRLSIYVFAWILDRAGVVECGVGVDRPWKYSACWDVQNYQIIAAIGYQDSPEHFNRIAFFPLYPLLMRWATDLSPTGGDVRAGVIVGHLALLGAAVYVWKLVRTQHEAPIAWRTLGYLLMFPSAFFFTAAYPEPVFLLSVAGTLYHARRGHWLLAGLYAAAGSATKLLGAALVVPIIVEALAQRPALRQAWRPLLGVALAPMGLVAWFGYLQWRFGDFLIFFRAQRAWGRSSFDLLPLLGIQRLLGDAETVLRYYPLSITPVPTLWLLVDTTLLWVFLVAGVVLWRKVRPAWGALVLAACGMLSLAGNPQSLSRYLVALVPVFVLPALVRNEVLRIALAIAFVAGLMTVTFFFNRGIWAG